MTVSSDSGDDLKVKALSGFLLIGYTGAASDYVKDCDVDISFKSVNFNWKGLIFWASAGCGSGGSSAESLFASSAAP